MTASASPPSPPTITVIGYGRREVRPDVVEFHFLLEGVFESVREAEVGLQHRRTELLRALERFRSREARLTAGEPAIAPQRDYEGHKYVFRGYRATDRLVLRAPLEPYLVTNVLQAVANQIESLSFQARYFSKKTAAAYKSARAEAVRDARRKASQYAQAAGHHLDTLRSLSDIESDEMHIEQSTAASLDRAPVDIDPAPTTVEVQIRAVWELVPAG